jgi:hypothetical protein
MTDLAIIEKVLVKRCAAALCHGGDLETSATRTDLPLPPAGLLRLPLRLAAHGIRGAGGVSKVLPA